MRHRAPGEEHESNFGHLQQSTAFIGMLAKLLCKQAVVMVAFCIKDFSDWRTLCWVLLAWIWLRVLVGVTDAVEHRLGVKVELWLRLTD